MYAIIESGGRQYKVSEGDVLQMEKLAAEPGETVENDRVLMVSGDGDVKIGNPTVESASVSLKVNEHGKGDKLVVFKYKPKKGYRRKQGHRQPYTEVTVESINAG